MAKKATSEEGKPSLVFSLSVLRAALAFVGQAIAKNPIVPVLENVKVYAHDGKATFTGSDLQTTLSVDVECDIIGAHPDGELLLLPFVLFSQLLATLTESAIVLYVDRDVYGHTVKAGRGTYKMTGENPIDFPRTTSSLTNPSKIKLTGELPAQFSAALAGTVYAISTDNLRPAMTGVSIKLSDGKMVLAGTSGFVLVRDQLTLEGLDIADSNLILPGKIVKVLTSLIDERPDDTAVELRFSQANVMVTVGSKTVVGRLIDERFPDYENAIPTNNPNVLTIARLPLMESLKRIILFANKTTHQIRLSIKQTELTISAEDLDYSNEGSEPLSCQYEGNNMDIGFEAKRLLSALSHIDSPNVEWHMSEPNKATIAYGENHDRMTLVMPVMLNVYA